MGNHLTSYFCGQKFFQKKVLSITSKKDRVSDSLFERQTPHFSPNQDAKRRRMSEATPGFIRTFSAENLLDTSRNRANRPHTAGNAFLSVETDFSIDAPVQIFSPSGRVIGEMMAFFTPVKSTFPAVPVISLENPRFSGLHRGGVTSIFLDGGIITGSRDGILKTWDPSRKECAKTMFNMKEIDTITAIEATADIIATGTMDGTFQVWNRETGRQVFMCISDLGPVKSIEKSDDRLFVSYASGFVSIYNGDPTPTTFSATVSPIRHTKLTMDGSKLLTACLDGSISVIDAHTFDVGTTYAEHKKPIRMLERFGDTFVSADSSHCLKTWDISQPKSTATFEGHIASILCVDLDEQTLVTGSRDQTVKVWDRQTGLMLANFKGHRDWIKDVKIQGPYIFSVSANHRFMVWNKRTGEQLHQQDFYARKNVNFLRFTDDGIVGAYQDGTVRKFDFSFPSLAVIPFVGSKNPVA